MSSQIILGIETSCDETAAALLDGYELIHHITATQLVHTSYGGVVPEYASREHNKLLGPVIKSVLKQADYKLSQIDGIAVTQGPGLAGSLLVGLSYAKGLALGLQVPLYGINHIEGHIFANSGHEKSQALKDCKRMNNWNRSIRHEVHGLQLLHRCNRFSQELKL